MLKIKKHLRLNTLSTMKSLVGEVACDGERELGAGFGLNPWSGSMFWAARGGCRVGSHVYSDFPSMLVTNTQKSPYYSSRGNQDALIGQIVVTRIVPANR